MPDRVFPVDKLPVDHRHYWRIRNIRRGNTASHRYVRSNGVKVIRSCPNPRRIGSQIWLPLYPDNLTPIVAFHWCIQANAHFQDTWERMKARFHGLLRQTDLAHQFGVTRIGAQGVEREVGAEAIQQVAVFLVRGVEPLEGMVLVTQLGI